MSGSRLPASPASTTHGRRASPARVTPRRASDRLPWAVLAITCLIGWAFKAHCGAYWTDNIQYVTGCYTDALPFWSLRGVAAGQLPYFQARMEYPVLTGALIWIEGTVTRLGGARADAGDFVTIVTVVNAALAFAVLGMMRRAGMPRARQYGWAAAPPLILYLGHNWDMLAVTLAIAAMLAARRDRAITATVFAALGVAAKLFPILLLPLLGLGALFTEQADLRKRVLRAATLVAVAIGVWGAVNLIPALFAFHSWFEFYRFSSERTGTAASIWTLIGTSGGLYLDAATQNRWSLIAFVAGAVAIVGLGWRRHGNTPWLLFTPVLAWFLLTNKVYSPQFDLWLYPMLLLTTRRLRPIAWFALGDLAAYVAEFWWFAGMATTFHIALAAAVRAAVMLWIIASAVFEPAPDWITRSRPVSPPPEDRPTPAD
jgi:uncharacterized membrane protein